MARKPDSTSLTASGNASFDELLAFINAGGWKVSNASPSSKSKWERIGKPLFTPSIEMAMYFTPMNPVVYRMIRGGLTAYDIQEGVYDYD